MPILDLLRPSKYTDAKTTEARRAICAVCPERTTLGRCKKCTCLTNLKTRLSTEKCPVGKW